MRSFSCLTNSFHVQLKSRPYDVMVWSGFWNNYDTSIRKLYFITMTIMPLFFSITTDIELERYKSTVRHYKTQQNIHFYGSTVSGQYCTVGSRQSDYNWEVRWLRWVGQIRLRPLPHPPSPSPPCDGHVPGPIRMGGYWLVVTQGRSLIQI